MIKVLKNQPFEATSTIKIKETDPEWDLAYACWIMGDNPTDSPEWNKGVYLGWED